VAVPLEPNELTIGDFPLGVSGAMELETSHHKPPFKKMWRQKASMKMALDSKPENATSIPKEVDFQAISSAPMAQIEALNEG
jgi:hypothetical protein